MTMFTDSHGATKSRKFRHVVGFFDNTDYMEIYACGRVDLIKHDGTKDTLFSNTHAYTIEYALDQVDLGNWKELV